VRNASAQGYRLVALPAAISVLLAVGGWLLLVGPQRHHAASTAAQVQQAQDKLVQLEAAASRARTQPKQPAIRTKALYRLEAAMPVKEDEPDLLLGLNQLAASYGVQVNSLSPGSPAAAVGYATVPISLSLGGTYSSLTKFLHRLRTLVALRHHNVVASGRLFSVTSVTLTPDTGSALKATVSLQAYVYGTVAGATPLATTTGSTDTTSGATTTTSGQ
jgi:Tfp pilus assembly protein PilO